MKNKEEQQSTSLQNQEENEIQDQDTLNQSNCQKNTDIYVAQNVLNNHQQEDDKTFLQQVNFDLVDDIIDQKASHEQQEVGSFNGKVQQNNNSQYDIGKCEIDAKFIQVNQKKLITFKIYDIIMNQLEFIQHHQKTSPIGQLLNINEIQDEVLVWQINWYDSKLKQKGTKCYVNQLEIHLQKKMEGKFFMNTYLKPQ